MTITADLVHRHFQTLVDDNVQWQTLIADDLVWVLPYAPSIGHPARLSGREEEVGFVIWFLGAVEQFRFFDLRGICRKFRFFGEFLKTWYWKTNHLWKRKGP